MIRMSRANQPTQCCGDPRAYALRLGAPPDLDMDTLECSMGTVLEEQ